MINGPPAVSLKNRKTNLQLQCDMFACRTDLDQKELSVLPSGQILTTGSDKFLKKYKQPEDPIAKFHPEGKTPVHAPLE